jgi:hypothetical protein
MAAADPAVSTAKKTGLFYFVKCLDGLNLTAISLTAILCLTIWGTIFFKHTFAAERLANRLIFCDFAKYYVCGKIATSEDRYSAYNQKLQADYTVRFALGDAKVTEEYIHYPPMDFPLMAPFALLPIESAYLAFCLLGSAIFLTGTYLLNRATAFCTNTKGLVFFWLAAAGSVPMLRTFVLGQSSVMLTGVAALYIFALLKNRPVLGGFALAITSIKPQYTIFLAIPALAQKRYKLIVSAAICELLLILAAVATIGLKNIISYPSILLHSEQTASLAGAFVSEMVNVRGLLAILFDDSLAAKGAAVTALAACAFLAFLWLKYCPQVQDSNLPQGRLLLAITVLFCLTFSPHTHLYDCLFIAVAALAAGKSSIGHALQECSRSKKIFACLFILYPIAGWFFLCVPLPGGIGAVRTAPFAVYNLALCAASVLALFSRSKASQTQANKTESSQTHTIQTEAQS